MLINIIDFRRITTTNTYCKVSASYDIFVTNAGNY